MFTNLECSAIYMVENANMRILQTDQDASDFFPRRPELLNNVLNVAACLTYMSI